MRKAALWMIGMAVQCFSTSVHAYDLKKSGRTELWDNPFIAYGYNPKTKITTGYVAALRTAPGRTDECKLVFSGKVDKAGDFIVNYLGQRVTSERQSKVDNRVSLVVVENIPYLKFSRKKLEGDCDWILPFVVEPDSSENPDEVLVEMEFQNAGGWISVYVIGAQRASFYSQPNSSSVKKAFLVKGDVIYVYDERPDWYYVKYEEGKRKAEGWIKKSDTIQP